MAEPADETFWDITVVERDGDAVHLVCRGPKGTIEVLTNMLAAADGVTLWNFHIQGPGPASIGIVDLRSLARAFGRMVGVSVLIIQGFERTTGANPLRRPRPIVIKVD